jgi:hypothetical protein
MRGKTNLLIRLEISIFFVVLGVAAIATGKVIHVDDSAIGANNGTNWVDAYNYLQDALADANTAEKPVEIRVAQGIYTPDNGAGNTPGNREAIFRLISGVAIRGGFAGVGAKEPNDRYIEAYKTILSGDLAGDDADVDDPEEFPGHPTTAENSYCVVGGNGTDQTAVMDGVTVTAAESGMRNTHGNPTIDNCTFTNTSVGISNQDNSQKLTDCIFKNNWFQAINQFRGSLTVINCLFTGNRVGVIDCHSNAELTLRDCTFIANEIRWVAMINCSFAENMRMYNCVFRDNVSYSISCIRAGVEGEFVAENCIFAGNVGVSIDHHRGRMVVSNCLFVGNKGGFFSSGINSWSKYVIIQNCTFSGNSSSHDGSALNLIRGGKVTNCIFWGNDQPAIDGRQQELFVRYCNVQEGWPGDGNIDVDPCFVSPGYLDQNGTPDDTTDDFWVYGNYHLQSQAGHWDQDSKTWVQDNLTSPCIDAGDPNSPIGTEPFPNGGRVNMGAYGATDKASKSYFGELVSEVIIAGDINGDGVVDDEDLAILNSHWMMRAEDFKNKPPTVRVVEPKDGERIARPGPTTFLAEAEDVDGHVDEVTFWIKRETNGGMTSYGLDSDKGTDGWEREYTWQEDIPSGTWTVWAEATDNEGQVGFSPEITITLYRP